MASLLPLPRATYFNQYGLFTPGYKLYTYAAGTTTPQATYTDQSGGTPNANPLLLTGNDSIWFKGAYKIDLKDPNGVSVPGYPVDNIIVYDMLDWSALTATIAQLNATNTSTVPINAVYSATLTNAGKTFLCDATSASFAFNLLPSATALNGYEITVKKIDVSKNLVTVTPNGSETIEGRTTFILYDQGDVITLLSDGSNWRIKSAYIRGNTKIISEEYTATIADYNNCIICSATEAYPVTLLGASTAGDGFKYSFKKSSDGNLITLTPAGMDTIDGEPTYTLNDPYDGCTLISDGVANWYVLNAVGGDSDTGEIMLSIEATAPSGWIFYDGGTIGNASSNASNRANPDTQALFTQIWNSISNTWSPIFNSDGTFGTRGATAAADYAANKAIKLSGTVGQALATAGTANHPLIFQTTVNEGASSFSVPNNSLFETGQIVYFGVNSGTLPSPLAASTPYYAFRSTSTSIQLAASASDLVNGNYITLTSAGSGQIFIVIYYANRSLGESAGEESHLLVIPELPAHVHSYTAYASESVVAAQGSSIGSPNFTTQSTGATGSNYAHNTIQPTHYVNVFIKL
jgi:microcystin-dependent protein